MRTEKYAKWVAFGLRLRVRLRLTASSFYLNYNNVSDFFYNLDFDQIWQLDCLTFSKPSKQLLDSSNNFVPEQKSEYLCYYSSRTNFLEIINEFQEDTGSILMYFLSYFKEIRSSVIVLNIFFRIDYLRQY